MLVTYERRESFAVITLNRPEKLNALSRELIDELSEAFDKADRDEQLRVVILTGAGRAFCAGTDLSEVDKASPDEAAALSKRGQRLCDQIEQLDKPVIAAVNGIAAGGGCELALACHLRVASPAAQFSLPETKLAIIPAYGGTQRLPREIGSGRALDVMLTGKTIEANEALRIGLVNRLAGEGNLLNEAESLAGEIARLAPLAIRACLRAVREGADLPLEEGQARETKLFAELFATEDTREGTRAFLEKRKPAFRGK